MNDWGNAMCITKVLSTHALSYSPFFNAIIEDNEGTLAGYETYLLEFSFRIYLYASQVIS